MGFRLSAFADEAGSGIGEQILALVENGISYLEIRGVDGENISDMTTEKAKEIRKRLDDAGISVWSLGSPYGKIGIGDDFGPHLEKFKHGMELADLFGAKHIRLFSFYVPQGEAEGYYDEVMARLEKFQEAARGSGVILCHENEKGIFGDTAARCAQIHREFPVIKAVFDPANFIQCKRIPQRRGNCSALMWNICISRTPWLTARWSLRERASGIFPIFWNSTGARC